MRACIYGIVFTQGNTSRPSPKRMVSPCRHAVVEKSASRSKRVQTAESSLIHLGGRSMMTRGEAFDGLKNKIILRFDAHRG